MFLTNNAITVNNLLLYSEFKHAYRVLKSLKFIEFDKGIYTWTNDYPNNKTRKIIKTGVLLRSYNLPPYGNTKDSMYQSSESLYSQKLNALE